MKKRSKIYTVRLRTEEEQLLYQTAHESGRSQSDVLREAIASYCATQLKRTRQTPYEAIASKIGCAKSGRGDLSTKAHELFRKALNEKRKNRSG